MTFEFQLIVRPIAGDDDDLWAMYDVAILLLERYLVTIKDVTKLGLRHTSNKVVQENGLMPFVLRMPFVILRRHPDPDLMRRKTTDIAKPSTGFPTLVDLCRTVDIDHERFAIGIGIGHLVDGPEQSQSCRATA